MVSPKILAAVIIAACTAPTDNAAGPPTITTASLPAGEVGVAYVRTIDVLGGTAPYTWTIAAGALPGGLGIASTTGAITGTPTAAGTFALTVRVADGANKVASRAYALSISLAPTITTPGLPDGEVDAPYNQALGAVNGTFPYTWSITTGALPAGLNLSAETGAISGTPTATGNANFTVKVTDAVTGTATKALSISINPASLAIATTEFLPTTVNAAFAASMVATGGTPPYAWSVASGALPDGIALASTGQVSGAATTAGTALVTLRVTDAATTSVTRGFFVLVSALPAITTPTLEDGPVGMAYFTNLQASGGTPPLVWSVVAGSLPAGFTLTPAGFLAGTPSDTGTSAFTVRVTDAIGVQADRAFTLHRVPRPVLITSALPPGTIGVAYDNTLTAVGGTGALTWTIVTGALPDGLTLNSGTGAVSGTPTTAGTSSVTVRATDVVGVFDDQQNSVTIGTEPMILTTTLPDARVGSHYQFALTAVGGTPPYSWGWYGTWPAGMTFTSNGVIEGTPTFAYERPQTFYLLFRVTDANVDVARELTLVVRPRIGISGTPLPDGAVGVPYAHTLAASGGSSPYSWIVRGLPPGLTVDPATGVVAGTPTVAGYYVGLVVEARDLAGNVSSVNDEMAISGGNLTITTPSVRLATQFTAYAESLRATGGTPPHRWSTAGAQLPTGLTLRTDGVGVGIIEGTPIGVDTAYLFVQATDKNDVTAAKLLPLRVHQQLQVLPDSLPLARAGQPYEVTLTALGGTPPYLWSGGGPTGFSVSSYGILSGSRATPGGPYFCVIRVTDALGATSVATRTITIAP